MGSRQMIVFDPPEHEPVRYNIDLVAHPERRRATAALRSAFEVG
jgi:hypothetical protein